MSDSNLLRGLTVAGLIAAALLVTPSAAHAAPPTAIEFVGETATAADFGDDWSLRLSVTVSVDGSTVPAPPTAGTVTVQVSGIPGEFATGLPVQPDGSVFVSQPLTRELIPAGEYDLVAIFVPAPGSVYTTSQTSLPAKLTIRPLEVSSAVEVVTDATISQYPVISARLTGSYVDARGGAPAGTWSFTAHDSTGTEVFTTDVAQLEGVTEPLRVEISDELEAGATFTVSSVFTPADEYSGGVTVADAPTVEFSVPGSTILDVLASRVAFPWQIVVAIGVFLVGLVATLITLAVKLTRRTSSTGDVVVTDPSDDAPRDPGESEDSTDRVTTDERTPL